MKRISERFKDSLKDATSIMSDPRRNVVSLGNQNTITVFDFTKRETRIYQRVRVPVVETGQFPEQQNHVETEPWLPGEGHMFNVHVAAWMASQKFEGDEAE